MTLEEWNELTQKIVQNGGDLAVLTSLVTQATDAFSEHVKGETEAVMKVEQLTKENEGLRKANMDLFVRIGQQTADELNKETKDEAEKITIADLFKED